jgi:TonB family protein
MIRGSVLSGLIEVRNRRSAAMLCALMLAGSVAAGRAWAQTASGQGVNDAAVAAYTSRVTAQLKLSPEQHAALQAFETAGVGKSNPTPMDPDALSRMSLPQKLDYTVDGAEAVVTRMRDRASAARHLYDLLSVEQRKALDALMLAGQGSLAPPPTDLPAPASGGGQSPGYTEPGWLVMPTLDEVARVYPRAALRNGITGSATLNCMVNTAGYLSDCTVSDETPSDAGFGNAALEITGYMRMKPATNYGVPVESSVHVPVNFHF